MFSVQISANSKNFRKRLLRLPLFPGLVLCDACDVCCLTVLFGVWCGDVCVVWFGLNVVFCGVWVGL